MSPQQEQQALPRKHVIVVTGYSRGIGNAMVQGLKKRANLNKFTDTFRFVYVGRSRPSADLFGQYDLFVEADLGLPLNSESIRLLTAFFCSQSTELSGRLEANAPTCLLYAAGTLGPLGFSRVAESRVPETQLDAIRLADSLISHFEECHRAYQINAANFANLVQVCFPFMAVQNTESLVFHLTSGAAINPYADLTSYSEGKAAALMFGRCLAEEVNLRKLPVRVLSIAPGTVETDMTRILAFSDKDLFPSLQKFRDLEKEKGFSSAAEVAEKLVNIAFDSSNIELRRQINGKYYDLRKPLLE